MLRNSPGNRRVSRRFRQFPLKSRGFSQQTMEIPIKPFIYDLLVHIIFEAKAFVQLFQLIKFGIIPDSVALANMLIADHSRVHLQFGVDMLKRLGCHDDVVYCIYEDTKVFIILEGVVVGAVEVGSVEDRVVGGGL